jgi:hypothetical protein
MRLTRYMATVVDPEGCTHNYVFEARTRRGARRQAREWVAMTNWGATFVGIERAFSGGQRPGARGRRLLAIAGVTFVVSGITISAMMIVGLSLEGAF